jgi:cytosine/uracil/thiamine/allantoin permease
MKPSVAVALIVIGGLLVLGPVIAHGYIHERDQQRVAEYYTRNGNAVIMPKVMEPTGISAFDWASFAVGVAMIWTGVERSKATGVAQ